MTHVAHNSSGTWTFSDLDQLAEQLGGNGWRLEHSPLREPTQRTVMITRHDQHGTHVLARVIVAQAAVDDQVVADLNGGPEGRSERA